MTSPRLAVVALALLALVGAGCGLVPGPRAHLKNLTDIPVAVHINGSWVGTYPPGAIAEVPIGGGDPPYAIEVLSPTGARLASIAVTSDVLTEAVEGTQSLGQDADVPCGTVAIWVGRISPDQGVNLDPPVPLGPCP